jgi:hypothetical protein
VDKSGRAFYRRYAAVAGTKPPDNTGKRSGGESIPP